MKHFYFLLCGVTLNIIETIHPYLHTCSGVTLNMFKVTPVSSEKGVFLEIQSYHRARKLKFKKFKPG